MDDGIPSDQRRIAAPITAIGARTNQLSTERRNTVSIVAPDPSATTPKATDAAVAAASANSRNESIRPPPAPAID